MAGPDGPDMTWVSEVFPVFGKLVLHVEDSKAFKDECEKLADKISNQGVTVGGTTLFRNVMFASLRSLLPRDWSAQHEVAWGWFWERVSRQLRGRTDTMSSLVQSSWSLVPAERPPENTSEIPVTFQEMANFNYMVLVASGSTTGAMPEDPSKHWTAVMIPGLRELVESIKDTKALKEACSGLATQLKAKGATAEDLGEFKPLMLCSLRSLLPHDWNPQHELAWLWFYETFSKDIAAQL